MIGAEVPQTELGGAHSQAHYIISTRLFCFILIRDTSGIMVPNGDKIVDASGHLSSDSPSRGTVFPTILSAIARTFVAF
jgi:hypothetical protein